MRPRLVALAWGLALTTLSVPAASTARAECDGPYPSFREAAPTAGRIVYGDVVEVEPVEWMGHLEGRSSRFVVEGWSLLADVVPVTLHVRDVTSQPCAGDLVARVGDRVAIALDAEGFTPRVEVNAIAWISGEPPAFDGIETTTLAEVLALAGVDPALLRASTGDSSAPAWLVLAAVVAVFVGAGLLVRRAFGQDAA